VAQPSAQSVAAANDNNNAQAATRPGAFANPTPGTIVVHINGRAHAGFSSIWTSAGERFATAPAGSPGGPPIVASVTTPTATIPATPTATILGTNGTGQIKLAPESLYSYARIYLGADAMATNGLRYGAAIELRQNFTGQISDNTSTGASVNSSLETLFVRRAFTYVAGDQWGIVRAGQADGIIGLFDNGVTTFQYLPTSNLQNGDEFASLYASRCIRAVLLPLGDRRRVCQHQAGLSLAAVCRCRFRYPVRAEHVQWLRHQYRQSAERLNHRRWHRDRTGLRHCGNFGVPHAFVRPRHPGRFSHSESVRHRRALSGHIRRYRCAGRNNARGTIRASR
jgi:hypothetical protein